MNEELQIQINLLKGELADLKYLISRKTGLGSANIKGNIVSPSSVAGTITVQSDSITAAMLQSNSVTKVKMENDSVGNAELDIEEITVNISAGQTSGTGTATNGSVIIGWRPSSNCDQIVKNVSISSTTVTVNLLLSATATTTIIVILLKT